MSMQLQLSSNFLLSILTTAISISSYDNNSFSRVSIFFAKNTIWFSSSDGNIFFKHRIDSELSATLSTSVPIKQLFETLKKFKGNSDVVLKFIPVSNPISLEIKSDNSIVTLPCFSSYILSELSLSSFPCNFTINSIALSNLLSAVKHALSLNEITHVLSGVFLHIIKDGDFTFLRAVATDSYRLAVSQININSNIVFNVIIPRKTVAELLKLLYDLDCTIFVSISKNQIMFTINSMILSSKLVGGIYPDYQTVISRDNEHYSFFKMETKKLINLINLANVIAYGATKIVNLKFVNGILFISSYCKAHFSCTTKCIVDSNIKEMNISFNAKYLLDILNSISNHQVVIKFTKLRGAFLTFSIDSLRYYFMIMPLEQDNDI